MLALVTLLACQKAESGVTEAVVAEGAASEAVAAAPAPAEAAPAAPSEAAPPADAPAFTPTASQDAMILAFSLRDGSPPCATVEAGSTDAVGDLRAIVQHVQSPPFVPMRAAECLLGHNDEVEITRWMTASNTKGLAMLAADRIDSLPVDIADRIVTAGLSGPYADVVKTRVAKSSNAQLRAKVGP